MTKFEKIKNEIVRQIDEINAMGDRAVTRVKELNCLVQLEIFAQEIEEEDDELSWEDMQLVDSAILEVDAEEYEKNIEYKDEEYYKEIFKRYKELKKKVMEVAEEIVKDKIKKEDETTEKQD